MKMKHTIQAISTAPTSPRIVLDISTEPASLAANETLASVIAAAGQIKFPATQNPSADANTLDDYEEGTFTPVITGSTTAGVGTYTSQTGSYTKIGRLVFFNLRVAWTAHTGTGSLQISLPFVSSGSGLGSAALFYSNITYTSPLTVNMNATASILLIAMAASNAAALLIPIEAAGEFRISGSYEV